MQSAAEAAIEKYEFDEDLTLDRVNYTNVNNISGLKDGMVYSEHYKQDVHLAESGVHVPIEIYEGCK